VRITKIAPIRRRPAQSNRVRVYTDGSSDNRKTLTGGWAAVILVPGDEIKIISGAIKPPTNNQVAELTAAVKGLAYVREHGISKQVEVISDSLYVVKGITEYEAIWRLNGWMTTADEPVKHQKLWMRLIELDGDDVIWKHIRGHRGNVYNEICDREASGARKRFLQNSCLNS